MGTRSITRPISRAITRRVTGGVALNKLIAPMDLTASDWAKTGATISANAANDSTGAATLDKIVEAAAGGEHHVAQTITGVKPSTSWRFQFEGRAAGRNETWVQISDGTQGVFGVVNLATGAFTSAFAGFGAAPFTVKSSAIEAMASGLYRVTLDFSVAPTTTELTLTLYTYNGGVTYVGDGSSGVTVGRFYLRR